MHEVEKDAHQQGMFNSGFGSPASRRRDAHLDLGERAWNIPPVTMPEPRRNRKRLSAREQRDLQTQIAFLEGLTHRDPQYTDALQLLGDAYTSLGRHSDSLTVDKRLSRLRPEDASVHYHLACSYAVTGQVDAAAQALNRALDLGFRDFRSLTDEPDLHNLRCHPSFARIRARIQTLDQFEA